MARFRVVHGIVVVVVAFLLTLSTAHASPPEATLAPPIVPPPPMVVHDASDSLDLTGEALWKGLQDEAVILVLHDGSEARGIVVAQSSRELAIARAADGAVVGIAKRDIAGVRVDPRIEAVPCDEPDMRIGRGLIGGGAFLLAFGGAASLSGTTILAIFPEFTFIHLPLLLPGLAMIGGGTAMVVAGKRKRADARRLNTGAARLRFSPIAGVSKNFGHVGLALRF
jgi:hypothetical protein